MKSGLVQPGAFSWVGEKRASCLYVSVEAATPKVEDGEGVHRSVLDSVGLNGSMGGPEFA